MNAPLVLGSNGFALAMEGVSVQFLQNVVRQNH
jgi:hypothetical protein